MSEIAVSVVMITYKHEQFIRQAIESVLNQDFHFSFELIVADDNSNDNTQEIIKDLIITHKNGGKIKYIRHEVNLGMQENFIFALKNVKGEFVALCEGDDFWTDNNKLTLQYNLMKTHNYDLSFHHGYFVNNNGEIIKDYFLATKDWCFTSFLAGQMPFTSSIMCRSNVLNSSKVYELLQKTISCDKVVLSISSLSQKVCLINFYGSAYRQHDLGVSKYFNKRNWMLNEVIMHNNLDSFSNFKFHKKILDFNANIYFHLAENYSVEKIDKIHFFFKGFYLYAKNEFSIVRLKQVVYIFLCIFFDYRRKK